MLQVRTPRDVYTPQVETTIGGRTVDADSLSIDRALPDPLAAEQLRAASGSVTVTDGPDVASSAATPWDPSTVWPPVQETPLSIRTDMGDGWVPSLTGGRVTDASGGIGTRQVEVGFADRYESLLRSISWEPVAEAMPAITSGNPRRFVGMWTTSITDQILRQCGWYSTPPPQGFSVLSVPAQGTLWGERGLCVSAGSAAGVGTEYPRFGVTSWGIGTEDASATYTVSGGYSIKARGRMELSALTSSTGGTGRVTANTGTGGGLVRLVWSDTTGNVWIGGDGMTLTAVATVARADGLLYATVEHVTDTSVRVILRSGTATQTVTVTVPASITTGAVTTCSILADGNRSGGYQVAFPATAGGLTSWTPNAVIHARGSNLNRIIARPAVQGESCVDLLAQQCEAESATYWIDELGTLHWWDLRRLEARTSATTLTSGDDLSEKGFTWSHDRSQVKSSVEVKWREAVQEFSSRATIDLWQGSGITLTSGTVSESWVNVPDDEVWLMPDTNLRPPSSDPANTDFNYGVGSWYGGVIEDTDTWAHNAGTLAGSITQVTPGAFKLRLSWSGTGRVIMHTVSKDLAGSTLWMRRRDFNLPILRGKSKVTFADRTTIGAATGPAGAPEKSIDAGWWIQYESQAQYTADYAAARVTVPQPVLSSVELIPIPGLQLGDIVTISDTHESLLTVQGIVIGDSRSVDADMGVTHTITVRPLTVARNSITWAEWAGEARPKTWREWYLNQQTTWAAWGADPLGKE
ncbi:hypothetical protein GCM10009592_14700 [Brachybacterium rhamnosum]|uniref:Minor tail protein n=1 Tax=Brachybacterium rhamnosum TaxID=173361 RepID=A0ABW4PYA6_9MICO